jgi:transglutaminase-like putative cysteine protease
MEKKSLLHRFSGYFTDSGEPHATPAGNLPAFTGIFLFPWLFSFAVMYAFIYAYTEEYFNVWIVASFVLTLVFFVVFDFLAVIRTLPRILLLGLIILICGLITGSLIFSSEDITSGFFIWFLSGTALLKASPLYLAAFTLAFSFFISAVSYYFGVHIHRKQWLVIIGVLPFIMFVKLGVKIPIWIIIMVVGLQLFIYLAKLREGYGKNNLVAGRKSVFKVYGDFAVALVLAVALIPKPTETPFWEEFEEVLGKFTLEYQSGSGSSSSEGIALRSGGADAAAAEPNRLLYTMAVGDENKEYLKLQSYPYYDADEDLWYILDENLEYSHNFFDAPEISYPLLYDLSELAQERDSELLSRYEIDLAGFPERVYTADITAQRYASPLLPAPSRATDVQLIAVGSQSFTPIELFGGGLVSNLTPKDDQLYRVSYYADMKAENLNESLIALSDEEYGQFLRDLTTALDEDSVERDIAAWINYDYQQALDWKHFNSYQSERLRALAEEITEGLTGNYDKAKAIEQYFFQNGFVYNAVYNAPVDSPEYFVFEGKTGTCSDFTTAFTLLAGYAGLSARYSEGYIPREVSYEAYIRVSEENGIDNSVRFPDGMHFYTVSTHDTHAYPEVFIGGIWMPFEPSVGGPAAGDYSEPTSEADNTSERLAYVIFFSLLGAAVVLFFILRPKVAEALFLHRVEKTKRTMGGREALRLLFSRITKRIDTRLEVMTDSQTVFEVAEQVVGMADLAPLIKPLSDAVFGDKPVTDEMYEQALFCYKMAIDKIKRS